MKFEEVSIARLAAPRTFYHEEPDFSVYCKVESTSPKEMTNTKKQVPKKSLKSRSIDIPLCLKATSLARGRTESNEQFLARVTHLHLQNKRIDVISNLDLCTNLKVLYLYDNKIERIENLEFAKMMSYLYVQNNFITSMPELEMPSLKKLYLDENRIEYVDKLENMPVLEELFLARQNIPKFSSLELDVNSLQAVAETLQVIDISSNGITTLLPLQCLYNLRRVFAQENSIGSIGDIEAVVSLEKVEEADFRENPVCSVHRYTDYTIAAASDTLTQLDGKEVLKHQQVAIRGLQAHRRKIGAAFPTSGPGAPEGSLSIFGEADGQALDIQYSEADDVAFGVREAPPSAGAQG